MPNWIERAVNSGKKTKEEETSSSLTEIEAERQRIENWRDFIEFVKGDVLEQIPEYIDTILLLLKKEGFIVSDINADYYYHNFKFPGENITETISESRPVGSGDSDTYVFYGKINIQSSKGHVGFIAVLPLIKRRYSFLNPYMVKEPNADDVRYPIYFVGQGTPSSLNRINIRRVLSSAIIEHFSS